MQNQSSVSIVIPFFNESEGILDLLSKIGDYHNRRKFEFDILFVDDGSTDGTTELIKSVQSIPYPCKIISLSKNYGSHAAVRAGFLHSTGNLVTCLPADLQISFDTVEILYAKSIQGFDVVNAVREINNIGLFEKIFSRFYSSMMRRYVHKDFPDKGIETVLINDKVRRNFNLNIESNSSFVLQILSMGFKSTFVDIEKTNRKIGKSKWTLSKKIKLLIDSFVSFSFAPIRFVSLMGICFFIIGFIWTIYIITRKLIFDDLASGWPTLMSILMIGFGVTNISLGIIAEYLWRTLDTSRKRPVFIIDEIIELNQP